MYIHIYEYVFQVYILYTLMCKPSIYIFDVCAYIYKSEIKTFHKACSYLDRDVTLVQVSLVQ